MFHVKHGLYFERLENGFVRMIIRPLDAPAGGTVNIHERIKQRRAELGMSLSDLARESGIARSYLYQLERGESDPTVSKAQAVARALGTSLAWLAGETVSTYSVTDAKAMQIVGRAVRELRELEAGEAL